MIVKRLLNFHFFFEYIWTDILHKDSIMLIGLYEDITDFSKEHTPGFKCIYCKWPTLIVFTNYKWQYVSSYGTSIHQLACSWFIWNFRCFMEVNFCQNSAWSSAIGHCWCSRQLVPPTNNLFSLSLKIAKMCWSWRVWA